MQEVYEEISDWHSAQLFRYKLNHYLYMSGWTAVFTVLEDMWTHHLLCCRALS